MSKSALCNVLLWKSSIDEDACMEGSKSKYNPLTKKEFIWGKQGKTYYIIKNKNSSSESGILESWTNSYLTALERIKPKNDIKIKPINDIEILGAGS